MRCICIQQNFGIAHIEIITFLQYNAVSPLKSYLCVCALPIRLQSV